MTQISNRLKESVAQATGGHRIYHVNKGRSITDSKIILPNNGNKQKLISLLGYIISKFVNAANSLPIGHNLYLERTFMNQLNMITFCTVQICSVTNKEEPDTRLILHALHTDVQFGKVSAKTRITIKCLVTEALFYVAITIHACRKRITFNS